MLIILIKLKIMMEKKQLRKKWIEHHRESIILYMHKKDYGSNPDIVYIK